MNSPGQPYSSDRQPGSGVDSASAGDAKLTLGFFLVELGFILPAQLADAREISERTGMPLGRTLVVSGRISDDILKAVLEAQSLVREGVIGVHAAMNALSVVKNKSVSLSDALSQLGAVPQSQPVNLIGDILLEARLITREQLNLALEQAESTGMPTGRVLVLSGIVKDELLASAINAQILIREGRVSREAAIKGLQSSRLRKATAEGRSLATESFYRLPSQRTIRLGELLKSAGILSEGELMVVLERGLTESKLIGQVLEESGTLSSLELAQALKLQQSVNSEKMSPADAVQLMKVVHEKQITLEEAVQERPAVKGQAAPKTVSFSEFLTVTKTASQDDIDTAARSLSRYPEVLTELLELSSSVDKVAIRNALKCYSLFLQERLSLEHAFVTLEFSNKKNVSIDEALAALHWEQVDIASKSEMSESEAVWEVLREQAQKALDAGELQKACEYWSELLGHSRQSAIDETRMICALEGLAKCRQQLNDPSGALALVEATLEAKKRLYGAKHTEVAACLNRIAMFSYQSGDNGRAERYGKDYADLLEEIYGPEHPHVASALENLSLVYFEQGKQERAEEPLKRAIGICSRALGMKHPTTGRLMRKYASVLRALHREEEAMHFDSCAAGAMSGTWKTVSINAADKLTE